MNIVINPVSIVNCVLSGVDTITVNLNTTQNIIEVIIGLQDEQFIFITDEMNRVLTA